MRPTIIRAKTPHYESMVNEIFGPVLTIYVYDDDKLDKTLKICDDTSPYALTGSKHFTNISQFQYSNSLFFIFCTD